MEFRSYRQSYLTDTEPPEELIAMNYKTRRVVILFSPSHAEY